MTQNHPAAAAMARLVELAETRNSGQIERIARFLAATYNGRTYPLNIFEMRSLDPQIGADMLAVLASVIDRIDPPNLIENGFARVEAIISRFQLNAGEGRPE